MLKPIIPANERERLAALGEYHILDAELGAEFDGITQLASEICQTPISLITLIDEERQLFKAGSNLSVGEIPRDLAFCAHAINHPLEPLVMEDMRSDIRFADHPFVQGDPYVVFYTGIPLTNSEGFAMGTLCVMDKEPKTLNESQLRSLKILAGQVVQLFELRKSNVRLRDLQKDLESRNEELHDFAYVVSHDIKSPLASIVLTSEMLRENFGDTIDEDNDQLIKVLTRSANKIKNLVDGVLAYYRTEKAMAERAEEFQLRPFLLSTIEMLRVSPDADIQLPLEEAKVFLKKAALEQIIVNLLQNALKYNDKKQPVVNIGFDEDDLFYHFTVSDNGNGISAEEQRKISGLVASSDKRDRFRIQDAGVGLSTVKKLVEKLSGSLEIQSKEGEGAKFSFSIKKGK